jgi:hypothetical protein
MRITPVTMNGKTSLGIFLTPSTVPWFSHVLGLVCMVLWAFAVMALSLSFER